MVDTSSLVLCEFLAAIRDGRGAHDISVSINRTSDGWLVARTKFNYLTYESPLTEVDIPGTISADTFVWLHIHSPPCVTLVNPDLIEVCYSIPVLHEELAFGMRRCVPTTAEDVLALRDDMAAEIDRLKIECCHIIARASPTTDERWI